MGIKAPFPISNVRDANVLCLLVTPEDNNYSLNIYTTKNMNGAVKDIIVWPMGV